MTKVTHLYVGGTELRMFEARDRALGQDIASNTQHSWTRETLEDDLADFFESAWTRGALRSVILADDLVELFVLAPPGNVKSLRDLVDLARLRCAALYDSSDRELVIAADWQPSSAFVVSAIDAQVLYSVAAAFRRSKLKLPPIMPRFCWTWNRCLKLLPVEPFWFAVEREAGFTVATVSEGRITMITHTETRNGPELDCTILQAALRLGVEAPSSAYLVGEAPDAFPGSTITWKPIDGSRGRTGFGGRFRSLPDLGVRYE